MFGKKSSNSAQKEKDAIAQFRSVTSTTETVAKVLIRCFFFEFCSCNILIKEYLKKHDYKVDTAINDYFSKTGGSQAITVSKDVEKLFEKYKEIGIKEGGDEDVDAIQGEGMMSLIQDLGLDPEDVAVFVLCWKFKVKTQYQISRDEFMSAFSDYKLDSVNSLKLKIPQWKQELKDPSTFKQFYVYVFDYSKAKEARSIPFDIAAMTWRIVLQGKYSHLDAWLNFVENRYKKAITKDTWTQFLDFTRTINDSFSNYDVEASWPSLIDDFVSEMKNKK